MRKLTIYRLFFTESDCYKSGTKQTSRGVQVHSTGANNPYLKRYVQPDDGRLGVNKNGNSHNRPGVDVCASAYIGKLADGTVAVYQTLPWDMRCWISGKGENRNANKLGYIGFELCEDDRTDLVYFQQAVMGAAVNLTAHLCQIMGVRPDDVLERYAEGTALAVMDHSELAARGLASGHADITHWLRAFGKRMNDFRREVQAAMDEGVEVTYIDATGEEEWREMNAVYEIISPNGGYVNMRETPDTGSTSLKRLYPGEKVTVTAMTGVWSKVLHNDEVGYIMTQFLRIPFAEKAEEVAVKTVITDEAGRKFEPVGMFSVSTILAVDGEAID
ncbi:MAG: SH3 domain-containing protein [Clostridia bacterium]|nr:SH3 domain-containing protein [Clostridia bacterium]